MISAKALIDASYLEIFCDDRVPGRMPRTIMEDELMGALKEEARMVTQLLVMTIFLPTGTAACRMDPSQTVHTRIPMVRRNLRECLSIRT